EPSTFDGCVGSVNTEILGIVGVPSPNAAKTGWACPKRSEAPKRHATNRSVVGVRLANSLGMPLIRISYVSQMVHHEIFKEFEKSFEINVSLRNIICSATNLVSASPKISAHLGPPRLENRKSQ